MPSLSDLLVSDPNVYRFLSQYASPRSRKWKNQNKTQMFLCLHASPYWVLLGLILLACFLITRKKKLMVTTIPPIGILIDFFFGVLMWTSLIHFLLVMVIKEDSAFILLRTLRNINAPLYMAINLIKPNPIMNRLVPLYTAFVLFILRYYFLPLLIGFDVWHFYDMPLERLFLAAKSDLGF